MSLTAIMYLIILGGLLVYMDLMFNVPGFFRFAKYVVGGLLSKPPWYTDKTMCTTPRAAARIVKLFYPKEKTSTILVRLRLLVAMRVIREANIPYKVYNINDLHNFLNNGSKVKFKLRPEEIFTTKYQRNKADQNEEM